jgi:hypothetical protein
MSELYREEESYWIYRDGVPHVRKSNPPTTEYMYDLQQRFPYSAFSIKKEAHTVEEVRSFQPLKRPENWKAN